MIETVKITEAQKKSRRGRNVALGLLLGALAVLFYVMAFIKMGGMG
jgi:uncharacterized protein involved in exopolysaccharide biosynthesis